ncbi:MAG: stage II sporulation protein M [Gemmatimonadaceae bacterium]
MRIPPSNLRPPPSLAQTIDVETPELVVLSYTVAGVASRAYAALIDYLICITGFVVVGILVGVVAEAAGRGVGTISDAWALAFFVFVQFVTLWGYYVLFEGLADGQTPGKRMLRLRVVRDGGYSVTFGASAVRNLVRFVDLQPLFTYAVGVVSIMSSKSGKRLGDVVAGTIVVREGLIRHPALASSAPPASPAPVPAVAPRDAVLTDDEFSVLARFIERRASLDAVRRAQLAAQLAARLAAALHGVEGSSDISRLVRLYDAERQARATGAAVLRATGAARERHAIIATRSPRWIGFAARLAQAQRQGLRSLGETGVRDFVADYRDLTADLAGLRTAARGAESEEVFYLSRLVAGAHNLLYRGRSVTVLDALRLLFVDAPREVRRSAVPIGLATLLFFGPAAIAYTSIVRQPPVARLFIPPLMIDRAEDGVRRARNGEGYITDPQLYRPVMASNIIANNIQVSFAAFALGVTAGLGTALILVTNGIMIGGVFGLYASKDIATLLLKFVAPHGVLELAAICICGGAGLLLAAALLLPGARTRRRALVENGRRAIRLVAASVVLLIAAGVLEGFVSPIEWWPLEVKLAVSGLTAVALWLYLRAGVASPRPAPPPTEIDGRAELLGLGKLGL